MIFNINYGSRYKISHGTKNSLNSVRHPISNKRY